MLGSRDGGGWRAAGRCDGLRRGAASHGELRRRYDDGRRCEETMFGAETM